ncbi:unnamed protein product [Arabidopsis lyrata]|uniref:Uncharacterized protein n=1 Tax=Arabidopsis lyrata subsp. lyrata TaxID=81972 RepID=D7MEM0_ARALL|nr:uncharacterized protein LOC9305929 [Arabidopsis lyrata subsp. lyrata]EFH44070.1 hypothetical protein ARALYDRAFT_492676 [Arabidopsis lyrata subsp. lyrata]CAH8275793.1 unnamed protein product [Arabidopsis lyrata]|eukprot:XP_020873814.1 uncharacterized protein LOC9305929 [Arabidopsis lyrata subsp. lyrata]
MGNCICVTEKTTTSWSGDDSGSYNKRRSRRRSTVVHHDDDGEKLLGETSNVTTSSSSSSCGRREIKIRMTKKELEDLMRNIGLKSLTAEEILSKLIFDGGDQIGFSAVDISNHHQPWKPALQSIPEID